MKLSPEHLRASYEIYMNYGNSSSATIISVLNKLRESEGKEKVVACAFGPGIALEMMVLRRRKLAPSTSNGLEHVSCAQLSNGDGATSRNTDPANGIVQPNGNTLPMDHKANGHGSATMDDTMSTVSLANTDGAHGHDHSTTNGTSIPNGEHNASHSLPVEDVD